MFARFVHHFAGLSTGLVILWCFLIWYLAMVVLHFESSPRLWFNALGMSAFVGTALLLSVRHGSSPAREFWRVFRLYAIPFCVSSFSALVRDGGFYAIFSPVLRDNLVGTFGCVLFLGWIALARRLKRNKVNAGNWPSA